MKKGEEKEITTTLATDQLRYVGPHSDKHFILQPGMKFKIGVGPYVDCRREDNHALCSDVISLEMKENEPYSSSCEAACNLWRSSKCDHVFYDFNYNKCWDECLSTESPLMNDPNGW